jgi:hypothetical protein
VTSKTKSKSKRKPVMATTRSTTNPTGGDRKMRPGCWRSGDGKHGRTKDLEQNREEIAAGFSLSGTDGTLQHGLKKETEPASDENREKNACLGGNKSLHQRRLSAKHNSGTRSPWRSARQGLQILHEKSNLGHPCSGN